MARFLIGALGSVFLLAVLLAGGYWFWSGHQPVSKGAEVFVIDPGDGVATIGRKLVQQGVIPEPYSFVLWSYQRGYNTSLKSGEYRIDPDSIIIELLEQFHQGEVITHSITLIEGWTFREFLAELSRHGKLKHTVGEQSVEEILSKLGYPGLHPEGRFFPDTYVFTADTTDMDILRQAFDRMKSVLSLEWRERDPNVNLDNPEQALILASIIEKETGKVEERETISGVFHNRLRIRMRLQTDPTVIYGLGDQFTGDLKTKHLRQDTPYNTYTRHGLPPTPIANPGQGAIHAALHPADTPALYFVSRGDGSHKFSATLEEHNQAVVKYQLGGKKKAFSSTKDE